MLVSLVCEGLVLFRFKGKTGHQLLRNFMALSKAQFGSQGKIKLQLLYGKSNVKERLLPEKREALPKGSGGIGDLNLVCRNSSSGTPEDFRRTPGFKLMNLKAKGSRGLNCSESRWEKWLFLVARFLCLDYACCRSSILIYICLSKAKNSLGHSYTWFQFEAC